MGLFDFSNKHNLEYIAELERANSGKEKELFELKEIHKEIQLKVQNLKIELDKFKPILDVQKEVLSLRENAEIDVREKKNILLNLVAEKESTLQELSKKVESLEIEYQNDLAIYNKLKEQISIYQSTLEPVNYGLYEPIFNYETSENFKDAIKDNNNKQKQLLKDNKAITSHEDEIYFQSKYKFLSTSYKKSINSYKKLISIAFNSECDALVSKVRWNNIENLKTMMTDIFYRINLSSREFCGLLLLQNHLINETKNDSENFYEKYSNHMIEISKEFLDLKHQELALYHEYHLKKQDEKEEERRIRELMREEEKARRDYEKAERDAEIEENKVQKAIDEARKLLKNEGADYDSLNEKIKELETRLLQVQEYKARAISMAQQTKRGFIYIISNIGSFGEDIYKIGMTRRLDPTDRVRELGGASVPFQFDIHAMIYSENAPALESEFHKTFADKKLNMINYRKEFFKITLEEIESKVNELNLEVDFIRIPEAMQLRETQNLLCKKIAYYEKSKFQKNEFSIFPETLPSFTSNNTANEL